MNTRIVTTAGTLYEDSDEVDPRNPAQYTITTSSDLRLREVGSLAVNTTLEAVVPETTMKGNTGALLSYTLLRVTYRGTDASATAGRSNADLNPNLDAPAGIYWFRQDKLAG